jgi:hypothetical protein
LDKTGKILEMNSSFSNVLKWFKLDWVNPGLLPSLKPLSNAPSYWGKAKYR